MRQHRRIVRLGPGVEVDPPVLEARWIGIGPAPTPLVDGQWYPVFKGPFYVGPDPSGQLPLGDFLWVLGLDDERRVTAVEVQEHEVEWRPLSSGLD